MKSMVIGGIILIVALMAGTYFMAGDSFNFGEDTINDLTMIAGLAIITITVFVALKYVNQIKNDRATGELAEENWDGIGEYKNQIPTGWGLAFIGTIVWALWYWTIGYPTNAFSQIGQWNEETLEYNKKFDSKWQNSSEEEFVAMGESIFLVQCAPCHGVDAGGIDGKAQNLTSRILATSVEHTIKNGANNFKIEHPGGMPPMLLTEDADIKAVSEYVAGGFKGEAPAAWATCAACHGDNGEGMEAVAPNLKNYDDGLITSVLNNGKKGAIGTMPSFKGRLNEIQYKAIAAYIRSLGK